MNVRAIPKARWNNPENWSVPQARFTARADVEKIHARNVRIKPPLARCARQNCPLPRFPERHRQRILAREIKRKTNVSGTRKNGSKSGKPIMHPPRFDTGGFTAKRELINTGTDKRFVRRAKDGTFKESDDVGKSLAADRRQKAKTKAKPGQGDKGDRAKAATKAKT